MFGILSRLGTNYYESLTNLRCYMVGAVTLRYSCQDEGTRQQPGRGSFVRNKVSLLNHQVLGKEGSKTLNLGQVVGFYYEVDHRFPLSSWLLISNDRSCSFFESFGNYAKSRKKTKKKKWKRCLTTLCSLVILKRHIIYGKSLDFAWRNGALSSYFVCSS